MKNNKLIEHKENIVSKIFNFIKKIFFNKKLNTNKNISEEGITNEKPREKFLTNIQIKENEEEKRLNKLKLQYDNGEIDEEDISDEDIDKLIALYKKETEEINKDTLKRKKHIEKMLKEMKK